MERRSKKYGAAGKNVGGRSGTLSSSVFPCEGSRHDGGPPDVTTRRVASREVRCSSECCMRPAGRVTGSLRPLRFVVSNSARGLYRPPSPARLRARVHPLLSFTPLRRLPFVPAPRLPAKSAFPGVHLPSSRRQPAASLQRAPTPIAFPPRRFSRPRGFAPPPALRVYFAPQPRTGFSHEKLQLAQATRLVDAPLPSRRWRAAAAAGFPSAPRPRASPSGPCSVRELRCQATVFSRRPVLPLVGRSSSRFSLPAPSERLHAPSAHGVGS
jgi:hypothetical protein